MAKTRRQQGRGVKPEEGKFCDANGGNCDNRATVDFGFHTNRVVGWSLYSMKQYWSIADATSLTKSADDPLVPYYRPADIHDAPWVPWIEPYPMEHVPAHKMKGAVR